MYNCLQIANIRAFEARERGKKEGGKKKENFDYGDDRRKLTFD